MTAVVVTSIYHEIYSRYNGIKYIIPIVNILTDETTDIAIEASMTLRDISVYYAECGYGPHSNSIFE